MDFTAEQAGSSFWESLRRGFAKLREECAINPPLVPAGQLSAIWESQPEPGRWRLNYRSGNDRLGIAQRFRWHAASGATRLGFQGDTDAGVAYWLDKLKIDAPNSHLRRLEGDGSLAFIEILDVCGLSADYCRKCEADEASSRFEARSAAEEVRKTVPQSLAPAQTEVSAVTQPTNGVSRLDEPLLKNLPAVDRRHKVLLPAIRVLPSRNEIEQLVNETYAVAYEEFNVDLVPLKGEEAEGVQGEIHSERVCQRTRESYA